MNRSRLDSGIAFIRRNRFVVALIVVGAIVELAVSLRSDSTTAVVYTGAIIGVLIGGVISLSQREKDSPGGKKRR